MSTTNIVHAPLKATKFTIQISGEEYKNLIGSVTEYNHPSVTLASVLQTTPSLDIPRSGSKLIYDPLQVRHIVDSGMSFYDKIHDWVLYNAQNDESKLRDITLTVYGTNNVPTKNVVYYDAFPEYLGTIMFTSTDPNDSLVSCDITFRYSHFETKDI